jgi:agmatinase
MDSRPYIPFGGPEGQCIDRHAAGVTILPLCYEHAPSYGTGSGDGPYHILTASEQLERLDEETLIDWVRLNIHTLTPLIPANDPARAMKEMEAAAQEVIDRETFLLSLGGDHAISLGPIMAAARRHPALGILQIDAHLDLRDQWNDSRYNHACVMRRVVEDIGLTVIPVGTRSLCPEEAALIKTRNISPFFAHQIDRQEDNSWIEAVVATLPETVYITIDLDGLDPSVIPGTGTPEPGGLSYRQLVMLLKAVGEKRRVVAADITELAKIEGSQVSETTAAKIATKIMVYCTGSMMDY